MPMSTARKSPSSAIGDELRVSHPAFSSLAPLQDDILTKARFFALSDSLLETLRVIQRFTQHGAEPSYLSDKKIRDEAKIEIKVSTVKAAVRALNNEGLISVWVKGHKRRICYNREQVIAFGNDTSRLEKWRVLPKPKAAPAAIASASAVTALTTEQPHAVSAPESMPAPIPVNAGSCSFPLVSAHETASETVLTLGQPSTASALELAFTSTSFALWSEPELTPFPLGAELAPCELSSASSLEFVSSADAVPASVETTSSAPLCASAPEDHSTTSNDNVVTNNDTALQQGTEPLSALVSTADTQSTVPVPAAAPVSVDVSFPAPLCACAPEDHPTTSNETVVTTNDTDLQQGTEPISAPVSTADTQSTVPVPAAAPASVDVSFPAPLCACALEDHPTTSNDDVVTTNDTALQQGTEPRSVPVTPSPCAKRSNKEVNPFVADYLRKTKNGTVRLTSDNLPTPFEIISLSPESFSDEELAQHGFKRSDFAPCTPVYDLSTSSPQMRRCEIEPDAVSASKAAPVATANAATQPTSQQQSLDSGAELSDDSWP